MICPHNNCKKKFKQPLELFNGIWFCPHCKESIFPDENTQLIITDENQAKVVESDKLFYGKWLAAGHEKTVYEKVADLKKAINLCTEASYLNNPYALVNMGYYFENNYVDSHKNIFARMRVAYLYYNAVCYNQKDIKISMFKGNKKTSLGNDATDNIKRQAAINLYNLLTSIPRGQEKSVLGINKSIRYEIEKVTKLLNSLGLTNLSSKTEDFGIEEDINHEIIFDLVTGASKSSKSFLFGIFRVNKKDIDNLVDKTFLTKLGNKKSMGDFISEGKIKVKIAPVFETKKGQISDREAGEFSNISNKKGFEDLKNELDERSYFIFLFNNIVDNEYVSKKTGQKLYNVLKNEEDHHIRKYIQDGLFNSYVFTSEDIHKFSEKIFVYQKTIESLRNYCLDEQQ